jgi:hypothetical protein
MQAQVIAEDAKSRAQPRREKRSWDSRMRGG